MQRLPWKSLNEKDFPLQIIFLDQEEGGRILAVQRDYLVAWVHDVNSSGFQRGNLLLGIPASEGHGQTIVTANDIHDHAENRDITYFVYNDTCPPSPGCGT